MTKLVQMHGGTVEAESQGLGLGSTFTIRLPCTEPVGSGGELRSPVSSAHDPSEVSPIRVMVVDDSQDAATGLAMLIELWGHVVESLTMVARRSKPVPNFDRTWSFSTSVYQASTATRFVDASASIRDLPTRCSSP